MNSCRPFLLPLLTLSLLSIASSNLAQTPEPRLHGPLREETRTLLPGSLEPQVLRAQDLGPLDAEQPIRGITLVFRRSDAQSVDLEHLLASLQDPSSSEFHHWLTPEDFGRRFGMADADLAATRSWLSAHGFEVTSVSRSRDRITFSGTAAEVSTTFGSPLHQFRINDELHIAPSTALSLPAELAAITTAVLHLSDLRPHPMARIVPRPAYTGATAQVHFLAPSDLAVMYDLPPRASTTPTNQVSASPSPSSDNPTSTSPRTRASVSSSAQPPR